MRCDLEWFRTFKIVYEVGTMSDAARELNLSQPGVSLQLSALESYIGQPLFERTRRKLIPNERATILYHQIHGAVTKMEEVETAFLLGHSVKRKTLNIGMFPGLSSQLLEPHMSNLSLNIILHNGSNKQLTMLLENGTVDMIVSNMQTPLRNIEYHIVGNSHFVLIAGAKTDISGFKALDINDKKALRKWLKAQLWYGTSEVEDLTHFWRLNFKADLDVIANFIVPDVNSIVRCLEHGEGLAVVPLSTCSNAIAEGKVIKLWEGYTPMLNKLYIGHRKKTLLHDEITSVQELIISEFRRQHPEWDDEN
jgi:DNA-binding transcriptional LysR family regulator